MISYSLLHPLTSVCFDDKARFSARQHFSLSRSKWFTPPEIDRGGDAWTVKAPDFSVKLYRSLVVPQRTETRGRLNPAVPKPGETKRRIRGFFPIIVHESYHRKEPPKFVTSHRPPDALESELMFVRTGKFPSGPYKNPKPHNFRPLDEDLPDMVTTYNKDAGNLHLKLKTVHTAQTIISEPHSCLRDNKIKMDTFKTPEPKWEARLLLPQEPYPPKSASYTDGPGQETLQRVIQTAKNLISTRLQSISDTGERHRRRRGAYSAFLERVEEKLSRSWKHKQ